MAMQKTEQKARKPHRIDWRLSLRTKWTLIVAGTMVLFFALFASVLYQSVSQILLSREQGTVQDTLAAVDQRLGSIKEEVTSLTVNPLLNPNIYNSSANDMPVPKQRSSFFSDSLIAKLSREDITVSVYDLKGGMKGLVFSTRSPEAPYTDNKTDGTRYVRSDGGLHLLATRQLHSELNNKHIGTAIVYNRMDAYNASMHRLLWQIVAIGALVFVLILAVSVFLMNKLIKPIRQMTETMTVVHDDPNTSVRVPALKGSDELSQLVGEFNGMLDTLQSYIKQQQRFVQDVSHELRTPVAVLEGHLQLLNRWGKDDPQVLAESLGASLQELDRMKHLIQEMLDLTRADNAATTYPDAVTVVLPVLNSVFNNTTMLHGDFQIEKDFDLPATTAIRMYRNHFEQVLIILVDNAIKYSQKRKEIHISAATDERTLSVIVQDFGRGIAKKDLPQIFNRFYRADEARSDTDVSGNGLGLSIAHRLVTEYGGDITVESVVGHGSLFRIDLPLFKGPLPPEEAAEAKEADNDDDDGLPPGIIKMS
ncbi:HAMP domain-containing sensor histidine kinase [Schleiferilactobacillus shenzhenensis]|nr:HAMP domain-containing histidine kinase [Schleiferilactobacillus shenzhenensis]